jgi:O-antigen/teichoic acid export membrane protein
MTIATGLAFIGTVGLPDALAYYTARNRPAAGTLVRRILPVAVAQACVLGVVQALCLALIVGDEDAAIRLGALITIGWIPAAVAYQYGLAVLQAERRFVPFNLLRVLPLVAYSALVVVAIVAGHASVPAVAFAWVVSYLAAGATAALLAARATRAAKDASGTTVREMASFGARGVFGQVSVVEGFRVDMLVAGIFLGAAPLGLYAVASAFTVLPMVIALSIGMVEYMHVAPLDRRAGRRTVLRYLTLTLVLCGAVVAVLEVILPTLLPWLFGDEFSDAVPAGRILLLAGISLAARRILSDGLRALGQPTAGTFAELLTLAVLAAMLAVLAPLFGISGVAAAVAISATVGALFLAFMLARSPGSPRTLVPPSPVQEQPL